MITLESVPGKRTKLAYRHDLDCSAVVRQTLDSTLEQGDRETVNRESILRALAESSLPSWVVDGVRDEFEKSSNLQKDNEELADLVEALKKTIVSLCS